MADDFRVKIGFLGHPKTVKLTRRLGGEGVIAFLQLWEFCASPIGRSDGSLVGMDDEEIEIAAKWNGAPGELVKELVAVRYLDGEPNAYAIHEWCEHQEFVASQCDRNALASASAHARWHRAGKHKDEPKEGCPLCQEDKRPKQLELDGSMRINATPMRPQCDRNAPTLLPSNLPTNLPTRECSENDFRDDDDLTATQVEQIAWGRFGQLGGKNVPAVAALCPIKVWELTAALAKENLKYWGGFVAVLTEIREEAAKPKPPGAGSKPIKSTPFSRSVENAAKWAADKQKKREAKEREEDERD